MIGEGCILKQCRIEHSVLGLRSRIESGCVIKDTLFAGADFYQPFAEQTSSARGIQVPVGVGCNTTIQRAIIDKNACIGRNVQIINKHQVEEATQEREGFCIRNGIVVVLKNAVIPDGTVI
jgi:glucose-1-phosphate adenylyltransferase